MAKSSSNPKPEEKLIVEATIPFLYQEYDNFSSLVFNTILSHWQKKSYTKVILTTQKIAFHQGLYGVKITSKELYKLSPDIEINRSQKYHKLDLFLEKIMKKKPLNFYDFSLYNEQNEEVLFLEMMPNGDKFAEQIRKAIINAKDERQVRVVQK